MEDLKQFVEDEDKMTTVWNVGISKNLPEGADTSQQDFQTCMSNAVEAVDLIKIEPAVMYSLYHYDLDENQEDEATDDLISLLKDFCGEDGSRGEQTTILGQIVDKFAIVDKFFNWLRGEGE